MRGVWAAHELNILTKGTCTMLMVTARMYMQQEKVHSSPQCWQMDEKDQVKLNDKMSSSAGKPEAPVT